MNRGLRKLLHLPGDLGYPVPKGATVLDLGCGNGGRVQALRDEGYDALGCDFAFKEGPHAESLAERKIIRTLGFEPYRLPFEDNSFDFVFSEQVFEHVRNYDETLAELHRVLAPGGVSLHVFPARLRVVEGHVHVPLASVYRANWWLLLWARAGIRKPNQRGMGAKEVAEANRAYLDGHTNYLPRAEIVAHVRRRFRHYRFCERAALRYSRLAPAYPLLRFVPFLGGALSTFQTRVLFLVKDSSAAVRAGGKRRRGLGSSRSRGVATEPALSARRGRLSDA